jgi:hypothetical protein
MPSRGTLLVPRSGQSCRGPEETVDEQTGYTGARARGEDVNLGSPTESRTLTSRHAAA